MSSIGGDHRVVFEIGDHGDKDAPSFDIFRNANEGVALPICNFDRLKSSSHFFDLILHFADVHLCPFKFFVVFKSFLAFFYVNPQFFHPTYFYINGFNDFLAAGGFAFWEFEHFFKVDVVVKCIFFFFHALFEF